MSREITSEALQGMIDDAREFALLDIRQHEDFIKGHLWLSINVPQTSIQHHIRHYVPRLDTRIVLIDQDQGLADSVAARLESMGYSDLNILRGGFDHWRHSGLPAITGDYVLAHAFGLYINQVLGTPSISADGLMRKLVAGEDILIIDSRDPGDFQNSTLPGAINIPIAEMVYRVPDLLKDDSTQVVVHCGGVTRGVLGAQTLIDAELANPVTWLVDGTTGWCIAGGELCRGKKEPVKTPSSRAAAYAAKVAQDLAAQLNLTYLEPVELEDWRGKNRQRTCYLIDVRSREEFLAGHYPDALHVPGGELVGMTQDHIATYHARLCLIGDAQTARAEITAGWMLKNGWDDVVILGNWQQENEAGISVNPEIIAETPEPSPNQAGKPETEPLNRLQDSIDSRQHIFESFMQDRPYRFNLNPSPAPNEQHD